METAAQLHCQNGEQRVFEVDQSRLDAGDRFERNGQGSIAAAYSADKIAFDEPVRKPFSRQGKLWVTVCTNPAERSAEAYRLETPEALKGQSVSYVEKVAGEGEAARRDPLGFYHGMLVKRGGLDGHVWPSRTVHGSAKATARPL